MCDEERRAARTIASEHLANIYDCTQKARVSIPKLGKYADEMVSITKNHMEYVQQNLSTVYKLNNLR